MEIIDAVHTLICAAIFFTARIIEAYREVLTEDLVMHIDTATGRLICNPSKYQVEEADIKMDGDKVVRFNIVMDYPKAWHFWKDIQYGLMVSVGGFIVHKNIGLLLWLGIIIASCYIYDQALHYWRRYLSKKTFMAEMRSIKDVG